jgi:hypothetical protein
MPTLTATPVAMPQGKEFELDDQEFELDVRISTIDIHPAQVYNMSYTAANTCVSPGCTGSCGSCYTVCGCTNVTSCWY